MSGRDQNIIAANVAVISGQISVLQRREAEVETLLREMTRVKNSVTTEIAELEKKKQTIISEGLPINWAPLEVLIYIMLLACGPDFHEPASLRVPVVLTQVCQKWRKIALSSPELWSEIWCGTSAWTQKWLPVFLTRSKNYPLDISFLGYTGDDDQGMGALFLIEALFPHFDRIRSLKLYCDTSAPFQLLLSALNDPIEIFPRLRHLVIQLSDVNEIFITGQPLWKLIKSREVSKAMTLSPPTWCRLSELCLENLPLFSIPPTFLTHVVKLRLEFTRPVAVGSDRPHASTLLHFLSHASQVEILDITSSFFCFDVVFNEEDGLAQQTGSGEAIQPVLLSRLRSLNWDYATQYEVQPLLALLRLPALEDLQIEADEDDAAEAPDHRPRPTLTPILHPRLSLPARNLSVRADSNRVFERAVHNCSFPSLTSLTIGSDEDATSEDIEDLESCPFVPKIDAMFFDPRFPHLTHLTLSQLIFESEFEMLGYLPSLSSLALEACARPVAVFKALQAVWNDDPSRMRFCPKLSALVIRDCPEVDVEMIVQVVTARNRALSIDGMLRTTAEPSSHVNIEEIDFEGDEVDLPYSLEVSLKQLGVQLLRWNGEEVDFD